MKLFITALAFLISILSPPIMAQLDELPMSYGLFVIDMVALIFSIFLSFKHYYEEKESKERRDTLWLLYALLFRITADFIYFTRGITHTTSMVGLAGFFHGFRALCYVAVETCLAVFAFLKIPNKLKSEKTFTTQFGICTLLLLILTVEFTNRLIIKNAVYKTGDPVLCQRIIDLSYILYSIASVIGTAIFACLAPRARRRQEFVFCTAFFIQYCFDFAVRYQMSQTAVGQVSPYRWGGVVTLVLVAWTLYYDKNKKWMSEFVDNQATFRLWIFSFCILSMSLGATAVGFIVGSPLMLTEKVTLVMGAIVIFFVICGTFAIWISERLLKDKDILFQAISAHERDFEPSLGKFSFFEFKSLANDLKELVKRTAVEYQLIETGKEIESIYHDSRSDHMVLEIQLERLAQKYNLFTDSTFIDLKKEVLRAKDRITGLQSKFKSQVVPGNRLMPMELTRLLSDICSELRSVLHSQGEESISIQYLPQKSQCIFVHGNERLRDALRNIIKNATESKIPGKYLDVKVSLAFTPHQVTISISDNGKGIPDQMLTQVGQFGFTAGKMSGCGIGLAGAKKTLESLGCPHFQVESKEGFGTTVTIGMSLAPIPHWHTEAILLTWNSTLVILDDAQSVHDLWMSIYEKCHLAEYGVKIVHFKSMDELKTYISEKGSLHHYFFMDYHLGERQYSSQLLDEFNIGAQTIFVTSFSEGFELQNQCLEKKAKLLSKQDLDHIPFEIAFKDYDFIVVDDDPFYLKEWQAQAEKLGLSGLSLNNPFDLLRVAPVFDKNIPIIIDYYLGEMNGIELCKDLHSKGFTQFFLSSALNSKEGFNLMDSVPFEIQLLDKIPTEESLQKLFHMRTESTLEFNLEPSYIEDSATFRFNGLRLNKDLFKEATIELSYQLFDLYAKVSQKIERRKFHIRYFENEQKWFFVDSLDHKSPIPFESISLGFNPFLDYPAGSHKIDFSTVNQIRAGRYIDIIDDSPETCLSISESGHFELKVYYRFMTLFIKKITILNFTAIKSN